MLLFIKHSKSCIRIMTLLYSTPNSLLLEFKIILMIVHSSGGKEFRNLQPQDKLFLPFYIKEPTGNCTSTYRFYHLERYNHNIWNKTDVVLVCSITCISTVTESKWSKICTHCTLLNFSRAQILFSFISPETSSLWKIIWP